MVINHHVKYMNSDFVVPDAAYNGRSARVGCFQGTRLPTIGAILGWKDEYEGKPVCWMSGPAGFGKSAVSQTVTESCARDGTLAASFFFLRGAGGRSSISHFITTLAFQITVSVPEIKPIVEMILQRDPTILSQSITYQLQNLIFVPFMVLAQTNTPTSALLIVIDALDECNDRDLMLEFITALAHAYHASRHLRLRWLLTSRGEEHIRQSFSGTASQDATWVVQLDNFDARADIKTFLEARFSDIIRNNPRLFHGIPLPWPSLSDFWALVDRSSGLFIFAATLVNFVTDGRAPPVRKLESVLRMHAGLDPLYDQVLRDALRDLDDILCFRRVLTTLMLLYEQPSVEMLAGLLELGSQDVLHALLAIQSIIRIPSDDNAPIQLNHTSLRDFLVNESRSKDLFIDPLAAHATLAVACVKVLQKNLKTDIISQDDVTIYAAKQWCRHLGESHNSREASPELLGILQDFISPQTIEPWINILIHAYSRNDTGNQLTNLRSKYEVESSLSHSGCWKLTSEQGSDSGLARVLKQANTKLQTSPHAVAAVPAEALTPSPLCLQSTIPHAVTAVPAGGASPAYSISMPALTPSPLCLQEMSAHAIAAVPAVGALLAYSISRLALTPSPLCL
ncbi:hypothetical protein HWV62_9409 [Athelia sp. TMB]|nr:hypothetical protein HWV62_9409 [Athelia sp. TMB]